MDNLEDREIRRYVNVALVKTVLQQKYLELDKLQEEIEALEVFDRNPELIDEVSEALRGGQ